MEAQRLQIAKVMLKKRRKVRDFTIPDLKLYYKDLIIKMVQYWHKNRHIDQQNGIENPEMGLQPYGQLIFNKAGKNVQWKKVPSTNGDGKTGKQHAEE